MRSIRKTFAPNTLVRSPKHVSAGFTLIELMVTLVVAVVLLLLAAPSFRNLLLVNRVSSAASDLAADLALARSEAARAGTRVSICKSPAPYNQCDTSASWQDGWIMFSDPSSTGTVGTSVSVDANDTVLRVREAVGSAITMTATDSGGTAVNFVQFRPTGIANAQTTFRVCNPGQSGYTVTVSATGRPVMLKTSC